MGLVWVRIRRKKLQIFLNSYRCDHIFRLFFLFKKGGTTGLISDYQSMVYFFYFIINLYLYIYIYITTKRSIYHLSRTAMSVEEMYEDFSADHANKTITMETHPHLPGPPQVYIYLSIYPSIYSIYIYLFMYLFLSIYLSRLVYTPASTLRRWRNCWIR